MKVLSGVYWSAGDCGKVNQDTVALQQVVTAAGRLVMAVVCDGIGGLPKGEMASGYAAERMIGWFYTEGVELVSKNKSVRRISRSIQRAIYSIHGDLQEYCRRFETGMGTTMSMLLLFGGTYLIVHLGDSRVYYWRRRMKPLTTDHCSSNRKLTKCINSFFWQKPEVKRGRLRRNSGFLLCTDGFRHVVTARKLEQALFPKEVREEEQIELRLRAIAEYSMEKGEQDDISAVYIKII